MGPADSVYIGPFVKLRFQRCLWTPVIDAQFKRKAQAESTVFFGFEWRIRNVDVCDGSRCREVGGARINASLPPIKRRLCFSSLDGSKVQFKNKFSACSVLIVRHWVPPALFIWSLRPNFVFDGGFGHLSSTHISYI